MNLTLTLHFLLVDLVVVCHVLCSSETDADGFTFQLHSTFVCRSCDDADIRGAGDDKGQHPGL